MPHEGGPRPVTETILPDLLALTTSALPAVDFAFFLTRTA